MKPLVTPKKFTTVHSLIWQENQNVETKYGVKSGTSGNEREPRFKLLTPFTFQIQKKLFPEFQGLDH